MTPKYVGNVNILDLRNATAESVAGISGIGNANIVLYTAETAGLMAKLSFGNLNGSVELPEGDKVKIRISPVSIGADYFDHVEEQGFPVIVGPLTVEPDVTAEQIEKGFSGMVLVGPTVCPEHLAGAIQMKTRFRLGPIRTYPLLKQVRKGSLELDLDVLRKLEDQTEMTVVGSLSLPDVLPADLLEQKIKRIFVLDSTLCRGENAAFLKTHLVEGSGHFGSIPAGFEQVNKPLVLDALLLQTLKTRSLYCKERVQVDPEVTAAQLDEGLEAIAGEEMILCPKALQSVMAKKCDLLKNQVIFYEGALWLVDDATVLRASYLDALEGKLTLVVTGELTVDAAVDEKTLAARLAKVHNLGLIRCTPAQMGAIQARLGLKEGSLEDSTLEEDDKGEGEGDQIGNANYLAL
jgi:hypothetical protein